MDYENAIHDTLYKIIINNFFNSKGNARGQKDIIVPKENLAKLLGVSITYIDNILDMHKKGMLQPK